MPTHLLLQHVEVPDGLGQDTHISSSASMPGTGSSMTPHSTTAQKAEKQDEEILPLLCMFCDRAFAQQEDLGPHVLTEHPTTLFEPTVLRVDAEFRIPGERTRPKPSLPPENEEVFSCVVCDQVTEDASELETHMRKHRDHFTYSCNLCSRRFREPWFLKLHMKRIHGSKGGPKNKAQQDLDAPVTINNIPQDQTPMPVTTLYKMCMVCGFFFPDKDSLLEHRKMHSRETELDEDRDEEMAMAKAKAPLSQNAFLQGLQLRPVTKCADIQPEIYHRGVAQLDPFNTYQAWQLATKGKIAVGPNIAKDVGQDVSSENEDSGSDKEELGNIWSESQGDKQVKEDSGRQLRSKRQLGAETPSPEPDQRSLIRKDKPTHCEDCGRSFRTYHQLVLHSRVHMRERGGEGSPTASLDAKLSRAGSLDQAEEGSEDDSEEGTGDVFCSDKSEDGFDRTKIKTLASSRICSYCGKTFRSSYCLNVHLRVHTGEKPFKCVYCDYAGAQKTSLRYHLDRHHKDKPYFEIPSRPVLPGPSPSEKEPTRNKEEKRATSRSKLWLTPKVGQGSKSRVNGKGEDRFNNLGRKLARPHAQLTADSGKLTAKGSFSADVHIKYPIPVNLKMEKKEIKDEDMEAPLNLSLKVSLSISATSEPRSVLIPKACASCSFKTLYPEVLLMHKRLVHKDKSDVTKKNGPRGGVKLKRFTGCPPALDGKDVTPLPPIDRRHPRRTKSPTPQPAKPPETRRQHPPQGPKDSPVHGPRKEPGQENQRYRAGEVQVSQNSSGFTELVEESASSVKKDDCYVVDRSSPPDRVGIGQRSYPVRTGVVWPSDSARLCLSSRFGSLPQMDFGEPSNKRLKYSLPPCRESSTAENPGLRTGDVSNRLPTSGRNVKMSMQGNSPSESPQAFAPVKTSPPAPGSSIDTDWNMINILRSYSPSDLASLYQVTAANPSHGGLTNPRGGTRASLYQHLPALPNIQRRDHASPISNENYGATDKSA